MNQAEKLRAAERRAEENRTAFLTNLATLRARVSAERLKADAMDKARAIALDTKARTVETVKAHPVIVTAGATAVGAYLLRKPLARLAGHVPVPARLQGKLPGRKPVALPPAPPAPQSWLASLRLPRMKVALMLIRYALSKSLRRIKNDRKAP